MPHIDIDFLNDLQDDYKKYPCLIETGTHLGATTFCLEPYFDNVFIIEFSTNFFFNTKNKYTGNKINFILGDSSIVFQALLPRINDKCIFFLDAHWCGDHQKASKDVPLEEEITHINNLFKNDAIIIIDDFRLFGLDQSSGKLYEDWSKINKENLLNILKDRINKVYHLDSVCAKDDRLVIHINALESK